MPEPVRGTLTRLVEDVRTGREAALEELFGLLYAELREVARRQRARWRDDHTLNTTALLHEAYVKLANQEKLAVESRAHFFGVAARAMRHILCNYARAQRAQKRGGGLMRATLDERLAAGPAATTMEDATDMLAALDDALRRLERIDERGCRVIECRFFGGLTVEETATALGISPRTVKRDWAVAQAWLHRALSEAS